MSKIVIGTSGGKNLNLDIPLLIPSRLLIQANSGGGKSWLLRRLAEQLYGKVQTIIIDPEGEFYTLREKFGYVLVGEGGETPADVRSAEMLAEKFLTLKANAVCDLYEAFRGKPLQQREWVRLFLNALLEAPRTLWHPLIVIVDEAHRYVPEQMPKAGSQVEREIIGGCKDAMIGLATNGRKRGFAAIWATQRLAKVDKDASAEMLNRLVGMTIEDVDVDRAADLMSVSKDEKQEFRKSLRTLNPGQFYAFGRAITTERKLVMVGPVETHHPETGAAAKTSEAPPTPEAIKGMLPKLADLPKQAEDKARSEAEYKREIRELNQKLREASKAAPDRRAPSGIGSKLETHQARTIRNLRSALSETMKIIANINTKGFNGLDSKQVAEAVSKAADEMTRLLTRATEQRQKQFEQYKAEATRVLGRMQKLIENEDVTLSVDVTKNEPITVRPTPSRPTPSRLTRAIAASNGDLTNPEQRILNAAAWLESIGVKQPKNAAVAFLAGYTVGGGGYNNLRGALRTKGLIEYIAGDALILTDQGRSQAQAPDTPLTTSELHQRVLEQLPGPHQKILKPLLEIYPDSMSNEELAEKAGYALGGGYNNPRGRLRSLGLVEYTGKGVKAADLLFLEDAA